MQETTAMHFLTHKVYKEQFVFVFSSAMYFAADVHTTLHVLMKGTHSVKEEIL